MEKRKATLSHQLIIVMVGIVLGTVIVCWFLNNTFLEKYYIYNKEKGLLTCFDKVTQELERAGDDASEYDIAFERLCSDNNINMLITNMNRELVWTSYSNAQRFQMQMDDWIYGSDRSKIQILQTGSNYTLVRQTDERLKTEYLVLMGERASGGYVYMRAALESIRESAQITNKFFAAVSVGAIVLSVIAIIFLSRSISSPIRSLSEISRKMSELDFDAKLSEKGLLVMDMDSTVIQIECIDEIAKLAGTGELVSAITESAMRGELDFEQSLRRRVRTLKGAPETILQQVREKLPLMPGLIETIKTLQQHGWKTAIASGGFTYFADYLKSLFNLDFAASNQFEIIDGTLTGNVKGSVVDAQYKANTLQKLAEEYNIPRKNTLAIGDGANDLAMMKVAGLGVAFHAKPKVQQQAQIVVNFADLTALLCLLSANDRI